MYLLSSAFVFLVLWVNLPIVITQSTTISSTTPSTSTNSPTYLYFGNVTARPQQNRTTPPPQNPEAGTTPEPMNFMGYAGARAIMSPTEDYEDEVDVQMENDLMLDCSNALRESELGAKASEQDQQGTGINAIKASNLYDPILHRCFMDNPYDLRYPPRRDGWREAPPKMRVRYAFYFVELVKFEVCCFIYISIVYYTVLPNEKVCCKANFLCFGSLFQSFVLE